MFIGIIVKWFMDPDQALSARELAEGMRILAERMTGTGPQDARTLDPSHPGHAVSAAYDPSAD
jgi:hypothetical protein